jgi:hypothetical protein
MPGQNSEAGAAGLANYKNWNRGLQLQWFKCAGDQWCRLDEAALRLVDSFGVFIVWRSSELNRAPIVLYVGHGFLPDALAKCRRDPLFRDAGDLLVTWAAVRDSEAIEGIAAYLYRQLRPIWGEVLPSAHPVHVNLPLTA